MEKIERKIEKKKNQPKIVKLPLTPHWEAQRVV